jgi:hypothetical protein
MNQNKPSRRSLKTLVTLVIVFVVAGAGLLCWNSPAQYVFYLWLARQHQGDYERLNAQTLNELPVYPGAEVVYIHKKSGLESNWEFSIMPPSLAVFYGIKERIPKNNILSYLGPSLNEARWQSDAKARPSYFMKEKRCVSFSFVDDTSSLPDVPSDYKARLAQYDTVYAVDIYVNANAVKSFLWPPQGMIGYIQCYEPHTQ